MELLTCRRYDQLDEYLSVSVCMLNISHCEVVIQNLKFCGFGKNSNEVVCVAALRWVGKNT